MTDQPAVLYAPTADEDNPIMRIVSSIIKSVGSPVGLLNSVLVILIFCRWKKIDSIVTMFTAMGVTDFLAFGCVGLIMLSGSITSTIYQSVIGTISDAISGLSMWMAVLMTIFKFATTLNPSGVSRWNRHWTVNRARIAICVTYVVILAVSIPSTLFGSANRGLFVTMSVFVPKIIPSVFMLSMGVGIIVNRCRKSTGDAVDDDEEQNQGQRERNEAHASAIDLKNSHDNVQTAQEHQGSEQSVNTKNDSQDQDTKSGEKAEAKDTAPNKAGSDDVAGPKESKDQDTKIDEKSEAEDTAPSKAGSKDVVETKDSQGQDKKLTDKEEAKRRKKEEKERERAKRNEYQQIRLIIFLIIFYSFVDLTTGILMVISTASPATLNIKGTLVASFRMLSFVKHCLSYSIYYSMYAEFRAIYRTTWIYRFFNCCKLRKRRRKMKERAKKSKKEESDEEEEEEEEENEDEEDDDDMDDDGGDMDFGGE